MVGAGIPVAMHFIRMATPLGIVTTAPVVMETSSRMSVTSKVPLTLLISGGTKKKRHMISSK